MCVKHSKGSQIPQGDMPLSIFRRLSPVLPHIDMLLLNGIGEPLLHPQLDAMLKFAKPLMPGNAVAGFQTNGQLMDRPRALSLVSAGLDRVCISVDSAAPQTFRQMRPGGELQGVLMAFDALNHARRQLRADNFQIGIEFVLGKENMTDLPATVEWAARQGASFAIVTHIVAHREDDLENVAYDQNTDAAVAFYHQWKKDAESKGIDIDRYPDIRWKFCHDASEQQIVDFVDRMFSKAADRDIFFHLRQLMERDEARFDALQKIFAKTQAIADHCGIDLTLPAAAPRADKRCDFIASGSMFVSISGDVHPCYFLWHHYICYVAGWQKYVRSKIFGNVAVRSPLEIWNQEDYTDFRRQVLGYDYPVCSNCTLAPCDYVEVEIFEQDCYTNTIPCCDCQWCLGVFQCMQ